MVTASGAERAHKTLIHVDLIETGLPSFRLDQPFDD
jgi:hypothetical protein